MKAIKLGDLRSIEQRFPVLSDHLDRVIAINPENERLHSVEFRKALKSARNMYIEPLRIILDLMAIEYIFRVPEYSDEINAELEAHLQESEEFKSEELRRLATHAKDPLKKYRTRNIDYRNGVIQVDGIDRSGFYQQYPGVSIGEFSQVENIRFHPDFIVGDGTYIGLESNIGKGVKIGKFCLIPPRTTIQDGVQIPDFTRIPYDGVYGVRMGDGFFITSEGEVIKTFAGKIVERLGNVQDFVILP